MAAVGACLEPGSHNALLHDPPVGIEALEPDVGMHTDLGLTDGASIQDEDSLPANEEWRPRWDSNPRSNPGSSADLTPNPSINGGEGNRTTVRRLNDLLPNTKPQSARGVSNRSRKKAPRHLYNSCLRKLAWKYAADAAAEAVRLGDGTQAYLCDYADHWHVGHPPKKAWWRQ